MIRFNGGVLLFLRQSDHFYAAGGAVCRAEVQQRVGRANHDQEAQNKVVVSGVATN
jgi:hypothetical protein